MTKTESVWKGNVGQSICNIEGNFLLDKGSYAILLVKKSALQQLRTEKDWL
jgi:hypothetical protein